MQSIFEELFEYIKDLEIIDTHEHLPPFEKEREKDTDVLKEYLIRYFSCDLKSAGLSREKYKVVINNKIPLIDRWRIVEPYWDISRYTGYGRALDLSVKAIYGIDKICGDTIEELNGAFIASLQPGHFKKVLKDKSKIKISLLHNCPEVNGKIVFDNELKCDKTFFRSVYPVDNLIYPQSKEEIENIQQRSGLKISCFEDWLEACESMLEDALKNGAVALKCSLAYERTLYFARVTKDEAEKEFNEIFKFLHMGANLQPVFKIGKKCQDYVMHFILHLANKKNLICQFHTGIQEGNGNLIYNSNPSLLSNLFLEYQDVDFDIFHIGIPYQNILSILAKNFPNVFIDMCWSHIVSPTASINALIEWIDTVPLNKISAFGGDYRFVDGVYGHQYLARVNVCKALTQKVKEGIFDIEQAKIISEMLFYKNPLNIFKLDLCGKRQ